jgi:hypothetical protein
MSEQEQKIQNQILLVDRLVTEINSDLEEDIDVSSMLDWLALAGLQLTYEEKLGDGDMTLPAVSYIYTLNKKTVLEWIETENAVE